MNKKKLFLTLLIIAGACSQLVEARGRHGHGGHGHRGGRHGHRGHHGHHGRHNRGYHGDRYARRWGWGSGWTGYNAAWWGYPWIMGPTLGIYLYSEPGVYRGNSTVIANNTNATFRIRSDIDTITLKPGQQKGITRKVCRFTVTNTATKVSDTYKSCSRSLYLSDTQKR